MSHLWREEADNSPIGAVNDRKRVSSERDAMHWEEDASGEIYTYTRKMAASHVYGEQIGGLCLRASLLASPRIVVARGGGRQSRGPEELIFEIWQKWV